MKRPDILTSRGRTLLRSRFKRALTAVLGPGSGDARRHEWGREHDHLQNRTVSDEEPALPRGRHKNLEEHMRALRPEFAGSSELCVRHARLCVMARRGLHPVDTINEFLFMWETRTDHLIGSLDSRWLLSAVDTFADYGRPRQQAIAGMVTAFFNAFKMAETENSVLFDIPPREALVKIIESDPEDFWDGIEGFRFRNGDMLRNLIERMDRIARDDVALHAIFRTLVERAYEYNSPLGRMMRANRHFGDGPWPK